MPCRNIPLPSNARTWRGEKGGLRQTLNFQLGTRDCSAGGEDVQTRKGGGSLWKARGRLPAPGADWAPQLSWSGCQ